MLAIFTDLDNTLLDADTYSHAPAQPALDALRARDIPLILCSSKTRCEMEGLREQLGAAHPYIAENGAVVAIPRGYFPFDPPGSHASADSHVVRFGRDYASVAVRLTAIAESCGVPVQGFFEMTPAQVAEITGLSPSDARLAMKRDHDEPFLILNNADPAPLLAAIEKAGMRWTRGGRFFHITDDCDKGQAVTYLLDCYRRTGRRPESVGLGDGLNDLPLLQACERQFIMPSPYAGQFQLQLPQAVLAPAPGPTGWNRVILDLLAAHPSHRAQSSSV